MAGSGPLAAIDADGWNSGSGWYDKHMQRRDKFLAEHPEWSIHHSAARDVHEASTGDNDNGLDILIDRSLGQLMDRLEARYKTDDESADSYHSDDGSQRA